MTPERTEKLMEELLLLDPSLGDHEADLRMILSEFGAKRPDINLDPAFVTSLRARILLSARKHVSPYAQFSFWAMRLVPIGAVALLLITLVPGDILHAPTEMKESSIRTDVPETALESDTSIPVRIEAGDALPLPQSGMYKVGGSEDADSTRSMKTALRESLPFTMSPQTPGPSVRIDSVSVGAPSFMVISALSPDGQEVVIGVSPLIMPGTTTDVPIYLRSQTHTGQNFTATLHTDNGNRVFTLTDDTLAIDLYGNSIRQEFEIISEYFE